MKKFASYWRVQLRLRFREQPSHVQLEFVTAFDQIQLRAIGENSHPLTGLDENYAPLFDLS
jgi:hypothetical protein